MAVSELEGKIRSRIEAILINDARNSAEMQRMAVAEEPMEIDAFAEERNLYQRIITNYRLAIGEVNDLLEENVGFLSALCRIVDTIKAKESFQEICYQIADCLIQDLGAEYCGLVFHGASGEEDESLYLEGVREQRKLLLSHGRPTLLGSPEFARVVRQLVSEAEEHVNIDDVYREASLNTIDFPGVVRALFCLPIRVRGAHVGSVILSHSLPRFFNQSHARVLKILASMISHLYLLTSSDSRPPVAETKAAVPPAASENAQVLSVILLNFENVDDPRKPLADCGLVRKIRRHLAQALDARDSILDYDDSGLLVLLPGTPEDQLPFRAARLQSAFECWQAPQGEESGGIRMNLGYSSCESAEDFSRTLEAASLMLRMDPDDTDAGALHSD